MDAMKCGIDNQGSVKRLNCNTFDDPLTLYLMPPVFFFISLRNISTSYYIIGTIFCTDILGSQTMYLNNFGDPFDLCSNTTTETFEIDVGKMSQKLLNGLP